MTIKHLVEEKLSSLLKEHPHLPYGHLFTAARYSIFSEAKRLRPLLLILTAESYDVPIEISLEPAAAIECIHTYSLIHDDLPCMDNDDLRRGKPSLHKVYKESHALLTGDYLLTFAFELIANSYGVSDAKKVALIQTLAKRIGAHGMLGGQVTDLTFTKQTLNWDTLTLVHHCKTAALITAALESGAILGNAPSSDLKLFEEIGLCIGLGFQLVDDLLDRESPTEKMSALSIVAEEKCREIALQNLDKAQKLLSSLSRNMPALSDLFEKMIHRSL